ncbi:MAG: hypothetical protein WA996_09645 [Candidatus Promineifilaceae bacterium]
MIAIVGAVTAVILGTLLWAQWRRWEEKKRRRAGTTAVAVGDGHTFAAGCLGIAGYMGLLFILVWFTLDIVEEADGPVWLNWVVAIGLLVGFFTFVYWASIGVGTSFALTKLVLDSEGIRLVRLDKLKTVVHWNEPWHLEQFADIHFRYRYLGERYTDYTLWMRLRQGDRQLILRFDENDERVGGLPPYEGIEEGYKGSELAEWLQAELVQRSMVDQGSKAVNNVPGLEVEAGQSPEQRPAGQPDLALMKALNFTDEDLSHNRDGAYKVRQVAHLSRDRWITMATYIVLALLFGWLAVRQVVQLTAGNSSETTIATLVVFLLVLGFCTLMVVVSYTDIRVGIQLTRIQGTVTLQYYEQSGEYWLRVKDTAVPITRQIFEAFEDQAVYDLYFAYHGIGDTDKTLLSAEKV